MYENMRQLNYSVALKLKKEKKKKQRTHKMQIKYFVNKYGEKDSDRKEYIK